MHIKIRACIQMCFYTKVEYMRSISVTLFYSSMYIYDQPKNLPVRT